MFSFYYGYTRVPLGRVMLKLWDNIIHFQIFNWFAMFQLQFQIQLPLVQSCGRSKTCSRSRPPSRTACCCPPSCCRGCRWSRTCARPSQLPASVQQWRQICRILGRYLLHPTWAWASYQRVLLSRWMNCLAQGAFWEPHMLWLYGQPHLGWSCIHYHHPWTMFQPLHQIHILLAQSFFCSMSCKTSGCHARWWSHCPASSYNGYTWSRAGGTRFLNLSLPQQNKHSFRIVDKYRAFSDFFLSLL